MENIILKILKEFDDNSKKLINQMKQTYDIRSDNTSLPCEWRLDLLVPNVSFIDDWRFSFHGYHCRFRNQNLGTVFDIPFTFPVIVFQPYSIKKYIDSSKKYSPEIKKIGVEKIEEYMKWLEKKDILVKIVNHLKMEGLILKDGVDIAKNKERK